MMDFKTKCVEERNAKIVELYNEGKKYTYTKKDSEGYYHIRYEDKTDDKNE